MQKKLQALNKMKYIKYANLVDGSFDYKDYSEELIDSEGLVSTQNKGMPILVVLNNSYESNKLFSNEQKRNL